MLAPLQRATGKAKVSFQTRDGKTVLDDLYQEGSGKIRMARPEPGRLTEAVLINTSGGLTDGDTFTTHAGWGENTTAIVTTQAAERLYKTREGHATISSNLSVAKNACALWLPQETIMFDHGAYERKTLIDMASSATLLAVETTMFGRAARGEEVNNGWLRETWQVRIDDRLAFADTLALEGDISKQLERRAIANGAKSISTIIFAGQDLGPLRDRVNTLISENNGMGGASNLGPLLIARLFAKDYQPLRKLIMIILDDLLKIATQTNGSSSLLPRVWSL